MKIKESKIGILIRTKNRPLCLERAIVHIISQTFKNWHMHILNDGGNFEEVERIIKNYESRIDGRVTLYDNRSSVGRGNALSQLISYSSEEYLLINDDDDTIEHDFLEKTSAYLDDNERCVGVVTSNYDVFETIENNTIKTIAKRDDFGKRDSMFIDYLSYLSSDIAIIPICMLFRKRTISLSGSIDVNLDFMEDYDFFVRLLMHGEFGVITETLASYHHRIDSNSDYDTTRTVMNQGYKDLYFNHKVRIAISNNDNLSKIICSSIIETRNKRILFNKIDTNYKNTIECISNMAKVMALTQEKINTISNNTENLAHSMQVLTQILIDKNK